MVFEQYISVMLGPTQVAIAAFLSVVLYAVFKRRAELSWHAIQNSFASVVVLALNVLALTYFLGDVDDFAQSTYEALHIPTIPRDTWSNVPLWIVVLIGIAARDFADYWSHRVMHTRWGWPTHAAHHSDTHVNALSLFRIHVFESILMSLSYIVLLTWLQMPQALPFVVLLQLLHGMYVHMDLPYTHGRFKLLVASPVFHRWHHADTPAAYGKNLANVMPIYDWLFGTYYEAGQCEEPMGALSSGIADKNPILIYIYPFQEWGRLIKAAVRRPRKTAESENKAPHSVPGE